MTKLGTAFVEIRPDSGGFSTALRSQLSGAISALGGPAAAIGVGLGAAIAGGMALAVGSAAKFEQGLSAVRAVAGATEVQMEAVRAKALQLGADTAFSATEAAGAMEELVKAGLSVEQVLNGAADAAVSLAAAGGVSLETAATISANALNQFGLGAAQVARVADIVAGAANASAIGVNDFALSLAQSGAVARTAGLSFEDTALAIAALGNAGIRGSDAGTSIKTFLQNLIPVTTRQTAAFRELGLVTEDGANRFFTAAGSVKSLTEIAGVLEGALRDMSDAQRLSTLEIMFGSDAIRAAAVFAREGAAGLAALFREMQDISAVETAATRMDNLAGSFEEFRGSLETVLIKLGTPLQGGLRSLVDLGTRSLNVVGSLGESTGLVATTLGDLVDIGADVVGFLGDVVRAGAPAAAVLAQLGGGAIILGLRTVADIVGPLARLLNENQVAADLLAGVLIGRLAVGFARAVAGASAFHGLGLARLFAVTAAQVTATTAATIALYGPLVAARVAAGQLVATLGVLAANPITWIALGGAAFVAITRDIARMKDEAQDAVAALTGPAMRTNSLDEVAKTAKEGADRLEELIAKRRELTRPGSLGGPDLGKLRELKQLDAQISALEDGQERLNRFAVKARENIAAIRNETGLSAEAVRVLASTLNIDLGGPFVETTTKVIDAARATREGIAGMRDQAQRSAGELEAVQKYMEELAKSMGSAFASASDITGAFEAQVSVGADLVGHLRDQAEAQKTAAAGADAVKDAQRGLIDSQRGVAAAQRQLDLAVAETAAAKGMEDLAKRNERVAREQDQLANAQERQAAAQERLAEAQGRLAGATGRTGGGVLSFLRSQLAEATTFQADIARLTQAGIDPAVVRELAEAGPKAAASSVAGILAEVRAGNAGAVNETVASLRNAQEAVKGQSLAFFREQVAESGRFRDNLKELIAAGIDPALVKRLAEAGPEAAAGAAAGIVAEVRAGNTTAINDTQRDLRTLLTEQVNMVNSYTTPARGAGAAVAAAFGEGMKGVLSGSLKIEMGNTLSSLGLAEVGTTLARSKGAEVGSAFSAGIGEGILANPAARTAAVNAVNAVAAAAKSVAGIRSPSRLFAEQIGGPLVEGIAVGMRQHRSAVLAEAESIIQAAGKVPIPRLPESSIASPAVAAGAARTGDSGAGQAVNQITRNVTVNTTIQAPTGDAERLATLVSRRQGIDLDMDPLGGGD